MRLLTRLAYRLLSPESAHALWQELQCTSARVRASISPTQRNRIAQFRQQRDLKLHLGCGQRRFDGWLNIDLSPPADLILDLREPLPFANASASLIYSEHTLEHLSRAEGAALLDECVRLLMPGGLLRIGVPDAELYIRAYSDPGTDFFEGLAHLGGAVRPLRTRLEILDHMARMGGAHRVMWDFETLRMALDDAGFREVRRFASGQASRPELAVDDPEHAFETLYVEASRP